MYADALRQRRQILVGAVMFTLVALLPVASMAQEYPSRVGDLDTSSGSTVAPGEDVTISGSGFASGANVTITIESDPVVLGSTTADATGTIAAVIEIPASIPAGSHTLKATGRSADGGVLVLAQAVEVTGQAGGGGGGGDSDGSDGAAAGGQGADRGEVGSSSPASSTLAFTGLSTTGLAAVAVALLLAGGAAVGVSRHRRHTRS